MIDRILKKAFAWMKKNSRLVLFGLLALFILMLFSSYIKAILFTIVFVALGAISKIYHRFFRSTVGIDLVLFFSLISSLVYNNIIVSFIVGFVGLAFADSLAMRFSHTSLISYVGLTAAILSSTILHGLPLQAALIILTVLYELVSVFLYNLMGSSLDKILVFLSTHILFNLFLILSFSRQLAAWMV
jgi:hypothetical protein